MSDIFFDIAWSALLDYSDRMSEPVFCQICENEKIRLDMADPKLNFCMGCVTRMSLLELKELVPKDRESAD